MKGEGATPELLAITDAHLKVAMFRAMRLVAVLALVLAAAVGAWAGWQTALLLLIGAAIAGTGLWEWQRLLSLIAAKLEAGAKPTGKAGAARVIVGFVARLLIAGAVLYVSLRSLHGSVYALLGGLGLAAVAMAIEAVKLVRS